MTTAKSILITLNNISLILKNYTNITFNAENTQECIDAIKHQKQLCVEESSSDSNIFIFEKSLYNSVINICDDIIYELVHDSTLANMLTIICNIIELISKLAM